MPTSARTGITLGKYILLKISLFLSSTYELFVKVCKKTFQKTIAEKNVIKGFSKSWAVPRISLKTTTNIPLEASGWIICHKGPMIDCLNCVLKARSINWEIIFLYVQISLNSIFNLFLNILEVLCCQYINLKLTHFHFGCGIETV